ncbi:uncharacterized protein LOC129724172 [Wyeomyia smithii]|uniref:uncharacterized protein LOC129724172 n=1 Tax=Wyeomyia smithii TaxID=174621 RepID=UPI0024681DF7|nr:uncharacterized protein LOC129724172 [Wyeomyia smithii]
MLPENLTFFWKSGGKGSGLHTGIIETRVANMRKYISPDERLFRRKTLHLKVAPSASIYELAAGIAALNPVLQNGRVISEGMAQCVELHKYLLDVKTSAFPGIRWHNVQIQQAFERIHPGYNKQADMEKTLTTALMLETQWAEVKSKFVRGAPRIMQILTNRGIKRTANDEYLSTAEISAMPLIRWINPDTNRQDTEVFNDHLNDLAQFDPHIVCIAPTFEEGSMFIIFKDNIIPCGCCAIQAIDSLLKSFDVLGQQVPPLLRKFYDFICIHLFKTSI